MGDQIWHSSGLSAKAASCLHWTQSQHKWCIRWPQGARCEELKKRLIDDRTLGKPAKGDGVCAPRPCCFLRAEETEDRVGARQQVTAADMIAWTKSPNVRRQKWSDLVFTVVVVLRMRLKLQPKYLSHEPRILSDITLNESSFRLFHKN